MKLLKIAMIAFSIIFCLTSLKGQKKYPLKEINIAIAEGNHAKELLLDKIYKLSICDSLLIKDNEEFVNLKKQISTIDENNQILENQRIFCINDLNSEKKKKNIWKNIGITEFFVIFVIIVEKLIFK